MYEGRYPKKRYKRTLYLVKRHLSASEHILDLGVPNPFTEILKTEGYSVTNTKGEDLDIDRAALASASYQAVTAFEIMEHLLNPFSVLSELNASKLFISVPLKLWFAQAYRSKTDPRDRHYHEFEPWQFRWLLEKSGWIIKEEEQFCHPVKKFGFRPILRLFTPRYLLIYAESS